MNSRRLVAVLTLLLMGLFCFLSSPVLSGEHPWDVDRPGNVGGGSPAHSDSSQSGDAERMSGTEAASSSSSLGPIYGTIAKLTLYFAEYQHPFRSKRATSTGMAGETSRRTR